LHFYTKLCKIYKILNIIEFNIQCKGQKMQILNNNKSKEQLSKLIDDVVDNDETVIITKNNKSAVVISLDEYNSWKETSYLLQSKKNTERLIKAINNVEENNLLNKELIEDGNN